MKRTIAIILTVLGAVYSCTEEPLPEVPSTTTNPTDPEGPDEPDKPEPPEKTYNYYSYGLGTLSITTQNRAPIDSKEEYVRCEVTLDGGGVYENRDALPGKIRGRGNSTWFWYQKKPYRLKLDVSTDIMEMAPNRDWVLLADFRDVTHLMNNVGFTLARELGLPHANSSRYVNLKINGKDQGLYMITEQVEEGGNRVKLDGNEGILLALDMNDGPGESPDATDNFYSTVFGTACAVKFPEDPDSETLTRVKDEYAKLETAIGRREWDNIKKMLDVDSMVSYILIQEIIANGEMDNDPSMRSGYIHRESSSSKWVMGPFWDADAGFGYDASDMFNYQGMCHTYFRWNLLVFGTEPYLHKGAMNGTASDLFCRLWGIPEFVRTIKMRWNDRKDALLEACLEQIDRSEEVIKDAAKADMTIWRITKFSHETEVKNLKSWLQARFSYLDTVINNYPEKTY